MRRLIVLLPCLNEAVALPRLLAELAAVEFPPGHELKLEALVVDDGSSDDTAAIARQDWALPVGLIRHTVNAGLGAALRSGLDWFMQNCGNGDLLAVMDADLTHPPALLPNMLTQLETGCAVVIASRYAPGGSEHGLSLLRRSYSRAACVLLALAARIPDVRDYTCGYRLYSASALSKAAARYGEGLITERSFVCMAELLCRLAACGVRCGEVPLELHYERKPGLSKMNVPVTIRRYVALLRRLLFTPEFKPD